MPALIPSARVGGSRPDETGRSSAPVGTPRRVEPLGERRCGGITLIGGGFVIGDLGLSHLWEQRLVAAATFAVAVVIALVFNLLSDGIFLSPENLYNIAQQTAVVGILATVGAVRGLKVCRNPHVAVLSTGAPCMICYATCCM